MTPELHVVFGAGQVGYPLAERLLAAGKRVRVAKRSSGHLPAGCEVALGDAVDSTFCAEAAHGAAVVYHCMNPPYDARIWAEAIPRYMDNLIPASARTRARMVVLDNVYMLGRPRGQALSEDTPMNPCSRKGEIRARTAARLFEAHTRGDVVATSDEPPTSTVLAAHRLRLGIFSGPARCQARLRTLRFGTMPFTRITTSRTWRPGWRRSVAQRPMCTAGHGCCLALPRGRCGSLSPGSPRN